MFDDLALDRLGHVDGYRETDTDVAAARRQDGGVDADQFAAQVHQRATGVAGVYRRIGLYEVLVTLDAQSATSERADDARRDSLTKAEWIADGDDEVADA